MLSDPGGAGRQKYGGSGWAAVPNRLLGPTPRAAGLQIDRINPSKGDRLPPGMMCRRLADLD